MFCKSEEEKTQFTFSRKCYKLSDAILRKYKSTKQLYKRSVSFLRKYEKERARDEKRCVSVISCCIEFYDSSEKLLSTLLTEILKPKTNIRHKKSVFVLLDKLVKLFYLFDAERFNNLFAFHTFALLKQSRTMNIGENKQLKMTIFISISAPMAHLFVSSFTSSNLELHVPTVLFKRNLLHLDMERRNALNFICSAICNTELKYLAMYFCATYSRFFRNSHFKSFLEGLPVHLRRYYETMLLLN
eukprot:jgi/Antlo1/2055/641